MAADTAVKSRGLMLLFAVGLIGSIAFGQAIYAIEQFNLAAQSGGKPAAHDHPFEAKFAAAYTLARQGRYQDASQLFYQLLESPATPKQIAAVQYNLGNIFMTRGLLVNRHRDQVQDEAEYLLNQARLAYQQSLRLDDSHADVRHNLDRVLSLLPENAHLQDEQDEMGIVMGNIATGLP